MTDLTNIDRLPETEAAEVEKSDNLSREIISDASFFTVCTYIYQAAAFGVGMVTKRFLGPEGAGIWSFFLMVLSYFSLQHLGMIDGSERQIAFYRGKGQSTYARKIKDNMFGTVGLITIIVAFCTLIFSLLAKNYLSDHLYWALIHIAFILPIHLAVSYVTVSLRATKKFKLLGSTFIVVAVLNSVVGIFLVWKWQLTGMFTAFCVINSVNLCIWYFMTRKDKFLSFKFRINKLITLEVLKVGFPITLFSLIWILLKTVDSVIIVSLYGTRELGIYALAVSVNTFIYHAPNAFSIVMFPRFQEKFGKSSDVESLKNFVIKPTTALAFFALPLLIGSAYYFVPPLITLVLPKFIPGILPLKILLSGTYWISLVILPTHLLITINKQIKIVFLGLIGIVLSAAGTFIAYEYSWGLPGTAVLVSVAYFIFYIVLYIYAVSHFKKEINRIKSLIYPFVGFIWLTAVVVASDVLFPNGDNLLTYFTYAILKFVVFIIFISPLFFYAEKQTQVISKCREHLSNVIAPRLKRFYRG
ncbi:MAG: oligosaccharide flippase family protein [candidate division Zixibacteria bacterium]|nr:oligosaccharide flippase family protein [candidate division Zixibacteria bacterium]